MYKFSENGIIRLSDNALIPNDPRNSDYQAYELWVINGGETLPADPPLQTIVPQQVTKFQGKAALLNAGLLSDVEEIMTDPTTPILIKLAWTDSMVFDRQSETVKGIAKQLKLTEKQVDDLFIYAAGVK